MNESGGFLLLHRALRNAGDALIFERARRLIARRHPTVTLDVAQGWRPLADQLSGARLASYRAIIICGGPGYAAGMSARYPLGDLDALPPVVLLALGCGLYPGTVDQVAGFRFDADDRRFLESVVARSRSLGARDPLTARVLGAQDLGPVLMTGDPAWYDLERLEQPPLVPEQIRRIAITPPANPAAFRQATHLFRDLAAAHPAAAFVVVHHRGVQRPFAAMASARGWEERDITGSSDGFAVYDSVDLHVGYRVHAHLYSTSRGILSYLVAEDARGLGMLEAMPGLGLPGFDPDHPLPAVARTVMALMPRVANAHRRSTSWLHRPVGWLAPLPNVAADLVDMVRSDERAGFPAHLAARATIRATLPTMNRMIDGLP